MCIPAINLISYVINDWIIHKQLILELWNYIFIKYIVN